MSIKTSFSFFFFCILSTSAFAQLTKAELKILKNVEKNYEESVSFLEKTVNRITNEKLTVQPGAK